MPLDDGMHSCESQRISAKNVRQGSLQVEFPLLVNCPCGAETSASVAQLGQLIHWAWLRTHKDHSTLCCEILHLPSISGWLLNCLCGSSTLTLAQGDYDLSIRGKLCACTGKETPQQLSMLVNLTAVRMLRKLENDGAEVSSIGCEQGSCQVRRIYTMKYSNSLLPQSLHSLGGGSKVCLKVLHGFEGGRHNSGVCRQACHRRGKREVPITNNESPSSGTQAKQLLHKLRSVRLNRQLTRI
mmetsp:Transcript_2873/g.7260  ORF Transcript_2873/g.7260 Transcript_2873/m.7260 type:complete len:241 (-) Transcript_2873:144-866(-)